MKKSEENVLLVLNMNENTNNSVKYFAAFEKEADASYIDSTR
jgi:hypothetical protein